MAVGVLACAIVFTIDALGVFWRDMPRRDFGAFYFSGEAWNAGGDIYAAGRPDVPNLNTPGLTAAVFGPLAHLPLGAAGLVWQAAGLLALAFSLWRIRRALEIPVHAALLALGIGLLTTASRYVWFEGQVTWLLLVPATEAWLAYRTGARAAAGAWLGVVIAVKPFFAVTAVILGFASAAAAALVSVSLTLLSLSVTPVAAWRDWLALGPEISVSWPLSASLWTLAARAAGAGPFETLAWSALPLPVKTVIAGTLVLLALAAWRAKDPDARWCGGLIVSLLASPLGWLYYLPLAAGGLVALVRRPRRSRALVAGLALSCVPMAVPFRAIELGTAAAVLAGAAYTWALLAMLYGVLRGDGSM